MECPNCHAELVWTGWLDWFACESCREEWVLDNEYLLGPFRRNRPVETVRTSLV